MVRREGRPGRAHLVSQPRRVLECLLDRQRLVITVRTPPDHELGRRLHADGAENVTNTGSLPELVADVGAVDDLLVRDALHGPVAVNRGEGTNFLDRVVVRTVDQPRHRQSPPRGIDRHGKEVLGNGEEAIDRHHGGRDAELRHLERALQLTTALRRLGKDTRGDGHHGTGEGGHPNEDRGLAEEGPPSQRPGRRAVIDDRVAAVTGRRAASWRALSGKLRTDDRDHCPVGDTGGNERQMQGGAVGQEIGIDEAEGRKGEDGTLRHE